MKTNNEKLKNAMIFIKNFVIRHKVVFIVIAAAILIPNIFFFVSRRTGKYRMVMLFEQVGSKKIEKEVIYVPKNDSQTKLETYISELLLGPLFHRARPVFSLGTKLEFCILKGDVLYVGLSEDAIFQDNEAADFYDGVELFKKAVKKNFPKIKDVEIFAGNVFIETKK